MSAQRILAQNRNLLAEAGVVLTPSSVQAVTNSILQEEIARDGSATVLVSGSYTGLEETTFDIEVEDDNPTGVPSLPALTGVGNGVMSGIVPPAVPQSVSVVLVDTGTEDAYAKTTFEDVVLVARLIGTAGNGIMINVDRTGLTISDKISDLGDGKDHKYSLTDNLEEGAGGPEKPLLGSQYEWGTKQMAIGDGLIPIDARRIVFGDDENTIYRQYKVQKGFAFEYHLDPPLQRPVLAQTPIRFVTGGRTVKVTKGATIRTYNDIITSFDFFNAIQSDPNTLIKVSDESVYSNDRVPGGQGIRELQTRTDAHALVSTGKGSTYATGFVNIHVKPTAMTQAITAECVAVGGKDERSFPGNPAKASLGNEFWLVRRGNEVIADKMITGYPFSDAKTIKPAGQPVFDDADFTVERKMGPGHTDAPKGDISVTDITLMPRAAGEPQLYICVGAALGPAAKDDTITLTYKRRPAGDCKCDDMPFPDFNVPCLSPDVTPTSTGGPMAYSPANNARLVALYKWYADLVRANSSVLGRDFEDQLSLFSKPATYPDYAAKYIGQAGPYGSLDEKGLARGFEPEPLKTMVEKFETALLAINTLPANEARSAGEMAWDTACKEMRDDIENQLKGWTPEVPAVPARPAVDPTPPVAPTAAIPGTPAVPGVSTYTCFGEVVNGVTGECTAFNAGEALVSGNAVSVMDKGLGPKVYKHQYTDPVTTAVGFVAADYVVDAAVTVKFKGENTGAVTSGSFNYPDNNPIVANKKAYVKDIEGTDFGAQTPLVEGTYHISGNPGTPAPGIFIATTAGVMHTFLSANLILTVVGGSPEIPGTPGFPGIPGQPGQPAIPEIPAIPGHLGGPANGFAILADRYRTRLNWVYITAGVSPLGKSDASTLEQQSADGCWLDRGDPLYWEVIGNNGGKYAPAFTNLAYFSSKIVDLNKKLYQSTHEFALQINVKESCVGNLKEGDRITISLLNASWPSTYVVGDLIDLSIVEALDIPLLGGVDGDNKLTWNVDESISGPQIPYVLDREALVAYNSGTGLQFLITPGAIPFALADRFDFTVEGGHFKWKKTGGAWTMGVAITGAPQLLSNGVSVQFSNGAYPSFVPLDHYTLRALQPNAASQIITPDFDAWKWDNASATPSLVIDLGSAKLLDILTMAFHRLPTGATAKVQWASTLISDNGATWDAEGAFTMASPVSAVHLPDGLTRRYLRLILAGAAGGDIGYLGVWLGFDPEYSAEIVGRREYKMVRGAGGLNAPSQYLGKALGGDWEWTEGSLNEEQFEDLLAMLDESKVLGDAPMILFPNIERIGQGWLARLNADQLDITDYMDYREDADVERRVAIKLPLMGMVV